MTIYQNPDHVSGILQQLYRLPLAKGDTVEGSGTHERTVDRKAEGSGEAKSKFGLFGIGADAAARLGSAVGDSSLDSTSGKTTSVWEYTQAYYLHIVRETLRENGLLRSISCLSDAKGLEVGELVEYTTEFTPDQTAVFLDILTPELVAEIVRYRIKRQAINGFDQWHNFEAQQAYVAKTEYRINAEVDLARAVALAVRTDFRSDGTREVFGHLVDTDEENAVTAITICDSSHFTVQDTDRIFDGRFTVLGKVTSGIALDRPALDRNKLLSFVPAEDVDRLMDQLNEKLDENMEEASEKGHPSFDFGLDSRVGGASFKVVPIAIYL
ncbi:hypothetical protein [uncultured Kocuria sp.]|uniref:DUF6414 family protein n=1 Tax=uncultured Kocuria sp. TaxID=259305 RepID=UPI002637E825|nr:hypothetical protein [uncultured Kocuria sp.]